MGEAHDARVLVDSVEDVEGLAFRPTRGWRYVTRRRTLSAMRRGDHHAYAARRFPNI